MRSPPHDSRDVVRHVDAQTVRADDVLPPGKSVNKSPAEWTYERLVKYILQFEAQLDAEHEIGGRLVSFGPQVQFHILDVGYWNPDIITFDGVDMDGNKMKLIQNVSQLNVLLVAMRKRKPAEQPRRIGFYLGEERKPDPGQGAASDGGT